jgi:site-specific recombinase XerC
MATKRTKDYNLERRGGGTWYVVLTVPPLLQATIGRKRLRKTTGTTDILKARLMRDPILLEMRREIDKARRGGRALGRLQEALEWREEIVGQQDHNLQIGVEQVLHDKALAIERELGQAAGKAFYDIASSQKTPLAMHHEAWLAEKQFAERQVSDYTNQVQRLSEWMVSAGLSPSIEDVTDKVASRYKAEALVKAGIHFKTANKWLSGLRSYWRWMVDAGHATHNPWIGKSLPKVRQAKDDDKRPFTDEEMQRLLRGQPDDELKAAILISTLTGMRFEEMFQLQVKHCQGGVFKVAYSFKGKTAAAKREVPIHSSLVDLVAGLCEGRSDGDRLLAGCDGGKRGTRSSACSKRFTTYRRKLGINDQREGKRQSLADFHSFRRWFITKADQAGCRREDIERVVGHAVQGQSLGVYSGGMTLEQRRHVVESVNLP